MRKNRLATLFALCLLLASSTSAFSSGFAIIEQSVSGLGNAFAGGAASAEDATTVFFNPAGITRLDGQQVNAGLHVIIPSAKFSASSAPTNALTQPIRAADGSALGSGPSGGDGGKTGIVPNLYYTHKLSEKTFIGLGINAPFGLTTDYDRQWAGRYHAKESALMTININPVFAYKVSEQLSVAAGISAQYVDVTLSSMVDGGLVDAKNGSAFGLTPSLPSNDVLVENSGDDLGFGFNLGLLYEFSAATRVGLTYRSEIKHKVNGKVESSLPASMTPYAALFQTQNLNATITLPASASMSLYHELSDKLAIMADLSWTEWSKFKELVIHFEGSGIAGNSSSTTTENWDDTWRYSVGATYQASEALVLRTGLAFDETPISDPYRTPRIPGADRFWIALGAGYQVTESILLDAAYTHLFVDDGKIDKSTASAEDQARGNLVGSFENAVDIVSASLSYRF